MSATLVPITDSITTGADRLLLLAGPCAIESEQLCMEVGEALRDICRRLDVDYVFKASFDKANRTSVDSFRGPGIDKGLEILSRVKDALGVPLVTDIHEAAQARPVAEVVDVLQIPAFLCRQTDLLVAAGQTGRTVNIKKGQFISAAESEHAVRKVESTGNTKIMLTERGTSFGYNNLVVDFRSLPTMGDFGYPVVFDATHSVQMPGAQGTSSGGQRHFVPTLARAAVAVGVDALFMEVHPDPDHALSDGPNMVPLAEMEGLLSTLLQIRNATR